ncbi:MAG: ABC transporter permease [Firmicutes bacterium]|nr:ABC transporter permease [[Eubacterium] siraeum]MCM1486981.1 ABC transporter permease [Bacillota bacterium]
MSNFATGLKTAWFGVKNNKNMLIVISIFCIAVFPAFTLISLINPSDDKPYYYILMVYGVIVSLAAGLVIPISFFSYLYNRSACDFFNAMPVRRSQYFWGYFAASVLVFLIPWSITALIHCFITRWSTNLWTPFLLSLGIFFVLYCSMTFAVTFSGSKLCAVLTFIIMNILPVMVALFPISAAGADTLAYGQRIADNIMAVTPVSALAWVSNEDGLFDGIIPIQIGFAIIELIASFFMFKYRKSESTMALAFPKTRYFYQYGVLLLAALFIDTLFVSQCYSYRVYYENGGIRAYNYTNFPSGFWSETVFFTLVFVLVAFILTNMILEKNPRAAFKKIRHYFFFIGGYGVFLLITVPLAINLMPKSVLPFTPKYAAVYAYGYEEITYDEYESINRNKSEFTALIYRQISDEEIAETEYAAEYASQWEYEHETHYYKKVIKDAFIVTDKKKLKELTGVLGTFVPEYNGESTYNGLIIYPADRSYHTLDHLIYEVESDEALPSKDYTELKIAFAKDSLSISSDIDEKLLDRRITHNVYYDQSIFTKESIVTRIGYTSDLEYISKYKDYGIELDPDGYFGSNTGDSPVAAESA